jgi:hypothetical protein
MNDFLQDACLFLNMAENAREEGPQLRRSLQGVLFFALGIERILKAILHDLNPTFVLVDPGFSNALPALFQKHILEAEKNAKEIVAKPNQDVITLRTSILRTKLVSPTVRDHRAVLFRLADYRDIICHHRLGLLDEAIVTAILWRDFPIVTEAFSAELNLTKQVLVGVSDRAKMEAEAVEEAPRRLDRLLDQHRRIYDDLRSKTADYDTIAAKRTQAALQRGSPGDWFLVGISCPACGHEAVLTGEVDYDVVDREPVPMGVFASSLTCYSCDLHLDDPFDLDYLKLHDLLQPDPD